MIWIRIQIYIDKLTIHIPLHPFSITLNDFIAIYSVNEGKKDTQ